MNSFRHPFFSELRPAKNILISGAGGGFDIFSGLPLYYNLIAAGKTVYLGNLTFSSLPAPAQRKDITPELTEVTADSSGSETYFPEKRLCEWFAEQGKQVSVYTFHRVGPKPTHEAYRALIELHQIDTVILVDGGTDSLMRGDEDGLGTPQEDMCSICAVNQLDIPRKMLACLGFGIDSFHGVSHAHVLEAVAELIRSGGFLGAFSLMREMPEVQKFIEATEYAMKKTSRGSIVCGSILSAIDGRFGDFHHSTRTAGSQLFINPLMSFYWCFQLKQVAERVLYMDGMRDIESYGALDAHIQNFRHSVPKRRHGDLPM